jgi:hypothetical protein
MEEVVMAEEGVHLAVVVEDHRAAEEEDNYFSKIHL